jgi:hypothetical protein
MNRLLAAISAVHRAAEEVENASLVLMNDCRAKVSLEDSRLLRERLLDAQQRTARAERYVLLVPVEKVKIKTN